MSKFGEMGPQKEDLLNTENPIREGSTEDTLTGENHETAEDTEVSDKEIEIFIGENKEQIMTAGEAWIKEQEEKMEAAEGKRLKSFSSLGYQAAMLYLAWSWKFPVIMNEAEKFFPNMANISSLEEKALYATAATAVFGAIGGAAGFGIGKITNYFQRKKLERQKGEMNENPA